nr:chromo domain protein LHP1 [Tanacetum cinerariifolium]
MFGSACTWVACWFQPLSASSTDKEKIDEFDVRIQDRSGERLSPSNGISNVNGQNFVWVCRSGGAKRRKSGAVKRFKQDSHPVVTNHRPDAIDRLAILNVLV